LELSGQLAAKGLPTKLNSSADLDALIPHIKAAIDGAKLWQYYVFDVQTSAKEAAAAIDTGKVKRWEGQPVAGKSLEELATVAKSTDGFIYNFRTFAERFGTRVPADAAAGFIQAAYPNDSSVELASKWGKILDILNVDLYAECNDDLKAAQEGIIGRLKFNRLDEHGPKHGEITKE
jgi:glycogen debranching enzyme